MFKREEYEEEYQNDEMKEIETYQKKIDGMISYLRRQLKEMGISHQGINALTRAFENFSYEEKNYQFTNGRREKVNDLYSRFYKAAF